MMKNNELPEEKAEKRRMIHYRMMLAFLEAMFIGIIILIIYIIKNNR